MTERKGSRMLVRLFAATAAAAHGQSLNQWVAEAIRQAAQAT